MEFCTNLWKSMEVLRVQCNSMQIQWNKLNSKKSNGSQRKSKDFYVSPWKSNEIDGILWKFVLPGIPWNSMDIHRYPWISIDIRRCQWTLSGHDWTSQKSCGRDIIQSNRSSNRDLQVHIGLMADFMSQMLLYDETMNFTIVFSTFSIQRIARGL